MCNESRIPRRYAEACVQRSRELYTAVWCTPRLVLCACALETKIAEAAIKLHNTPHDASILLLAFRFLEIIALLQFRCCKVSTYLSLETIIRIEMNERNFNTNIYIYSWMKGKWWKIINRGIRNSRKEGRIFKENPGGEQLPSRWNDRHTVKEKRFTTTSYRSSLSLERLNYRSGVCSRLWI